MWWVVMSCVEATETTVEIGRSRSCQVSEPSIKIPIAMGLGWKSEKSPVQKLELLLYRIVFVVAKQ